ncbi:MAG: response regulator transcription factor [Elusimicrobia bacterium]|nr:response regulator transcription factor [Elusimicrobiota bacterium]
MTRHQVLVVEDEEEMQGLYQRFFEQAHAAEFSWLLAKDADSALTRLAGEPLDLVILDWTLPGLPGLAVLKALRQDARTRALGVLMVTGRSSPEDAVEALEGGADDFLPKPFDERVLLARLRSLLRRRQLNMEGHRIYELLGLKWDLDADRLWVDGRRVRLSPKETDLLRVFLERPDMLHSRAYLWDMVWGYEAATWEHILDATLSSLRRKLGPRWGGRLETHKGKGFSLTTA